MLYKLRLSNGTIIVEAEHYPQIPVINTVVADPLVLAIRILGEMNI